MGSSLCGGGSCLRLPLVIVNNRVGNDKTLRISDENKIASLGGEITAPLCVARVY